MLVDVPLPTSASVYLMDKPNAEQTLIFAGHLLPSTKAEDRFITNTAINLLGGQFTARLNMNLREQKHWAYGAYTGTGEALGQRNLFAWAPVQTDKTVESIKEVAREFDDYVGAKPGTQAELDRLIANDVRSLPGQYETAAAAAGSINSIVVYGYPDDYVQADTKHPSQVMAALIRERGWGRRRIGLEMDGYYFSPRAQQTLVAELPDATFGDAGTLVNWVRIVKSPREIDYMRQAGTLVEQAMHTAIAMIEPGVRQCDVAAAFYQAAVSGRCTCA